MFDRECSCKARNELGFSTVFGYCTHNPGIPTDYDDLVNAFDDINFETEHHLAKRMNEEMENSYQDTFDASRETLLVHPSTAFQYSNKQDLIHVAALKEKIKYLEDIIDQIKTEQLDNYKEECKRHENEKKEIEDYLKGIITQDAEKDVFYRFHEMLHNERGFMVHSYTPEKFIAQITDRAKGQRDTKLQQQRDGHTSTETQLTPLEEKLMAFLGMTSDIENELRKFEYDLTLRYPKTSEYTPKMLHDTIKAAKMNKKKEKMLCSMIPTKDEKKKKGKLAKENASKETLYSLEEAKVRIKIGLIHYFAKKDGEFDFLLCLPDYKVIMNLEVKFQLDEKKENQAQFDHLVNHSARQNNDHDEYFSKVHASIFGPGWQMIKISIVLPGTSVNKESLCLNCRKFLITEDILKSQETFLQWWKGLGLVKVLNSSTKSLNDPNYLEYLTFLRRIVGPTHVRELGPSPWKKIMGATYNKPICMGFTEGPPSPTSSTTDNSSQERKFRDFKRRPMDADHMEYLYLTKEQSSILGDGTITKAILISDFGGGKII